METNRTGPRLLAGGVVMIGRTVSHYKILEHLGGGGMGVVYKAQDLKLDRPVALKFLPPHFGTDPEEKARFVHEAQAASSLDHNNICNVHEIDETPDGQIFIVMAHYEGETLKKKIERGPMKIDEAVEIAVQVAQGLVKAHEHDIVHRDIKPANIMVTTDGVAKIVDFGLAKLTGQTRLTKTGTTLGTAAYMSPEQTRGDAIDHRSDIWSLGVVLYEMATGQLPFKAEYDNALFYAITNAQPAPMSSLRTGVPLELERIVNKALEKDPGERYQHADELLADLRHFRRETERRETSVSVPGTHVAQSRRPLRTTLLSAGVIILLAIAFFILKPFLFDEMLVSEPKPIAVISFANQTGDKTYDYLQAAIPNLLITNLEQSKYLRVTTWERMLDIAEQMGKPGVQIIDREMGFEICRRGGIDAIVLGSFVKAGNMFATDVKVLNVRSKTLLKSASAKGEGVESILKSQIDELSREISRGVGLSERRIEATPLQIGGVSTSSMEAYNYYLRGKQDYTRYLYADARRFLEKAVTIDSGFAAAYLHLGMALRQLSNTAEAHRALEMAKKYAQKSTRKEKLLIDGLYAYLVENNGDEALRLLHILAEEYPEEKDAYLFLGLGYSLRKMHEPAIQAFEKLLTLDPGNGDALNYLAYIYSEKGDFDRAVSYLKKYAAVFPGDPNPFDSMGEMYFRMGRLDEAMARYNEALEAKPDFMPSYLSMGYIHALNENYLAAIERIEQFIARAPAKGFQSEGFYNLAFVHFLTGQARGALEDLTKGERLANAVGNTQLEAMGEWSRGWYHYESGEIASARKCFNHWFALRPETDSAHISPARVGLAFAQGMLDIKAGNTDSAASRLAELRSILPHLNLQQDRSFADYQRDLLQAELLLARDSLGRAIEVFASASQMPIPTLSTLTMAYYNIPQIKDGLARAYLRTGRTNDAIAEYERLTRFDPQGQDRRFIPPRYHYDLGRLYEQRGEQEKAANQYKRLLVIWQNADSNTPARADAKRRLDGLRGRK
jgi:serine/threonine protein kinase/Tfp pilus assembly protein PilF